MPSGEVEEHSTLVEEVEPERCQQGLQERPVVEVALLPGLPAVRQPELVVGHRLLAAMQLRAARQPLQRIGRPASN